VGPPYLGVVDAEDKGEEDNRTFKRQTYLITRGRIVQVVAEGEEDNRTSKLQTCLRTRDTKDRIVQAVAEGD
jgi:hypothetical protein